MEFCLFSLEKFSFIIQNKYVYCMTKPIVSVVIPAFNEEKIIGKCLSAFVAQQTSMPFEIIVVNNNSTDNTE
ncbi:MAG: glycosyltransferase family 2 protein, partial [Candidatus Levyibacteriota bacterium]